MIDSAANIVESNLGEQTKLIGEAVENWLDAQMQKIQPPEIYAEAKNSEKGEYRSKRWLEKNHYRIWSDKSRFCLLLDGKLISTLHYTFARDRKTNKYTLVSKVTDAK